MSYQKKSVQYATENFSGVKNGRKIGGKLNTVQKNALLQKLFLLPFFQYLTRRI